jgi:hypothetical protein
MNRTDQGPRRLRQMGKKWAKTLGLPAIIGLAAAVLLLPGSAAPRSSKELPMAWPATTANFQHRVVPPLDAAAPAVTQTATFALG